VRILLVNPCLRDARPPARRRPLGPPLGPAYIAAGLERAGFPVSVLDMAATGMRPPDVAAHAATADLVGISASMTCTIPACLCIARHVKRANPRAVVVLGGNHATFEYPRLLQEPAVDAVCLGEGEATFLDVAERVAGGRQPGGAAGVATRDETGAATAGPARPRVADLDALPPPARHLLPLGAYERPGLVATSRGCPFGCSFCSTSAFNGRRVRRHSIGRILSEIATLAGDYACRDVEFSDDTFTLSRPRVLEFCAALGAAGLDIRWSCSTRVDAVDPGLLREMREAGCWRIFLGVESASQEVLDGVAKRIDVERAGDVFEWCRRLGIKTVAAFIVGLPGETLAGVRATADFIRRARPDVLSASVLKPFPGTPVRERAAEFGIRDISDDYSRFHYISPACSTTTMSADDIRRGYVMLWLAMREVARARRNPAGDCP